MKLIKKGTLQERIYTADCTKCGSVFEAMKEELNIEFHRNELCIQTERCPECETYGLSFKLKPTAQGEE